MPVFKNRSKHKKFYRPDGMRYAHGETRRTIEETCASALTNFFLEFHELPAQEHSNFEILGVTGGWAATVLEIKE